MLSIKREPFHKNKLLMSSLTICAGFLITVGAIRIMTPIDASLSQSSQSEDSRQAPSLIPISSDESESDSESGSSGQAQSEQTNQNQIVLPRTSPKSSSSNSQSQPQTEQNSQPVQQEPAVVEPPVAAEPECTIEPLPDTCIVIPNLDLGE